MTIAKELRFLQIENDRLSRNNTTLIRKVANLRYSNRILKIKLQKYEKTGDINDYL